MTCIIGVVNDGKVYIGGDSAATAGLSLILRADEKVFINDRFVMGFTTSFRMGQILRYKFSPPKPHKNEDLMEYMVTDFIDALRSCLKSAGYAQKNNEEESGGTFLVGVGGRLFSVEDDYQVGETMCGYHAVGCGHDLAKGALHVTPKADPKPRILAALEAAAFHSAGVSGPFIVKNN